MKANKYYFFSTNELKASGWLKKQLRIQADGLCGNLDKIWPDVKDSAWIGGNREGWERVPYWLDGFIPLAYLLEDEDMIQRVKKYIDGIISFQKEDGWICPCKDEERADYDTWAVLLILKVLCLYADCSNDERITEVVRKCLKNFDSHLMSNTLRNWGAARWFEGLISISWLYEKTQEAWLLDLAYKLRASGFNWDSLMKSDMLEKNRNGWDLYSHIVNISMMIKSEALWSKFDDIEPEKLADSALEYLLERHGTAIGHFNGDECLAGNSPIQGAELCSIVELMYSYECLFSVTGNIKWLDKLEELAYNSLPAAISSDMWTHQYVQMVNQVACYPMSRPPFRTNNREAHLFGLEPNYGCCTANFGQGFPKLALSTFMRNGDEIASCVLSPAILETKINEVNVCCELVTDYPFRNTLTYYVTTEKPVEFTLSVRIPGFVKEAMINGEKVSCGEFVRIKKVWADNTELKVNFELETQIMKRPENMICIRRGALFYSIPIEERWEKVEYECDGVERKFPYCDYYIYPNSTWNYALTSNVFSVAEHDVDISFDSHKPPVSIETDAVEIEWDFQFGHCERLPKSLIPISKKHKIKLIPYGCTNLRMTEIPFIM